MDHLERQKGVLQQKLTHYQDLIARMDHLIRCERASRASDSENAATSRVEVRQLEAMRVVGVRMVGRYSDCGKGFATLFRRLGRHVGGKPLCLFYDGEYRAEDANFEPCVPVLKEIATDEVTYQELSAGQCLSLMHRGPYEELSRSYARVLQHASEHGYRLTLPTREVYHKGPGMLFRGNPKKYLTEIQLPIEP